MLVNFLTKTQSGNTERLWALIHPISEFFNLLNTARYQLKNLRSFLTSDAGVFSYPKSCIEILSDRVRE